jgi:hypothetical protein
VVRSASSFSLICVSCLRCNSMGAQVQYERLISRPIRMR